MRKRKLRCVAGLRLLMQSIALLGLYVSRQATLYTRLLHAVVCLG